MKYIGSKRRLAPELLPYLMRTKPNIYIEPFVGGANMIDKIDIAQYPFLEEKIGCDINRRVIKALRVLRDAPHRLPVDNTKFSETDFTLAKQKKDGLSCFANITYSYFASGRTWSKDSKGTDYVARAYRNALKQHPLLQDVKLYSGPYQNVDRFYTPDDRVVIYCDPPYKNRSSYGNKFSHKEFFRWCRKKSREGVIVLISELSAPSDFKRIWSKPLTYSINPKGTSDVKDIMESLFVHKRQAYMFSSVKTV